MREIILLKHMISDSGYLDSTADSVPNVLVSICTAEMAVSGL